MAEHRQDVTAGGRGSGRAARDHGLHNGGLSDVVVMAGPELFKAGGGFSKRTHCRVETQRQNGTLTDLYQGVQCLVTHSNIPGA